ncbi:ABC transporter substrate-binding protein [Rhodoferax sp.]|uniref:substrate-binding periplasmic protein n=1 Tax=Rhodoferax sp. TaxID=50421 RepID=UPI002ACE8E3E|nr:ABC transporter substrate-binding protein [Rhodoferax sp.]MDZ7918919.1 ABC transporter substrate-binding protein [Rhodoferax sp.]
MVKLFVACVLGLLLGAGAGAADIAVFSGDGSPPKMYVQEGKNRGILIDILQYADQHLHNDSLQLALYPWARAYLQASSGDGGIVGLSWTRRREELFDYSDPLFFDEVAVVVRKGNEFPFRTLSDLRGKRVGIVRDASYGEAFEKARDAGVFVVDGDNGASNRLHKLMAGRIDCALFNVGKAGFEETLRIHKDFLPFKNTLVVLPVPLRSDPNFLAFPKSMHMKPWLVTFNQVIKKGYARGDIPKIIAQNLGS